MQPDQEFISSVVIIGGIVTVGLLVVITLTFFGIAIYRKKKETKLRINEKERSNGQHISRGKW